MAPATEKILDLMTNHAGIIISAAIVIGKETMKIVAVRGIPIKLSKEVGLSYRKFMVHYTVYPKVTKLNENYDVNLWKILET